MLGCRSTKRHQQWDILCVPKKMGRQCISSLTNLKVIQIDGNMIHILSCTMAIVIASTPHYVIQNTLGNDLYEHDLGSRGTSRCRYEDSPKEENEENKEFKRNNAINGCKL